MYLCISPDYAYACLVGHYRCKAWFLSKCIPYNSAMPIRKVCETYCNSGETVYIYVLAVLYSPAHPRLLASPQCLVLNTSLPRQGISLYMWSVASSTGKRYMYTGCIGYSHSILHAFRFEHSWGCAWFSANSTIHGGRQAQNNCPGIVGLSGNTTFFWYHSTTKFWFTYAIASLCTRQVMRIPCWRELTSSKQLSLSGPTVMFFMCVMPLFDV